MSDQTKIEWSDSTFNPWIGCTKVGPGCDHCYAATQDNHRKWTPYGWGAGKPRKRTSESNWKKPLMWNKHAGNNLFVQCAECGLREFRKWDNTLPPGGLSCCSNPDCLSLPESDSSPVRPRVFCASLSDWLDNEVPIEWLVDLLDLIRQTPELDWLQLTKRIGNLESSLTEALEYVNGQIKTQTEREEGLSPSSERGIRDRSTRPDMEGHEADIRPLDEGNQSYTLQKSKSGIREAKELPAGSGDDQQKAPLRSSSEADLVSFQRTDTAGNDNQPQGRQQTEQQPEESRTCDIQRTANSRNQRTGREASRCERVKSHQNKSDRIASDRNAGEKEFRRKDKGSGSRIRFNGESRISNMPRDYLEALSAWITDWLNGKPPSNVWMGITVINQEEADRDIPKLLQVPAHIRFLSVEPMLAKINLNTLRLQQDGKHINSLTGITDGYYTKYTGEKVDWVICGGESGPNARPMHPDWARSLRDQCIAAGVPFLFKQWGTWKPVCAQYPETDAEYDESEDASLCGDICMTDRGYIWEEGYQPSTSGRPWLMDKAGKAKAGRALDDRTHDESPKQGATND